MDSENFYESFTIGDSPHWKCATCRKGVVSLNETDIQIFEIVTSKETRESSFYDWDPSWIDEHFIGTMTCNNHKCQEKYSIAGLVKHELVHEELPEQFTRAFYPQYIYPNIRIFEIPDEVTSEVVESIENAFKLYWIDNSACGNAIRRAVEILLTDKKIRKTKTLKDGKRQVLNLHQRIELFKEQYPEIGELIMAIKWIGNVASHDDDLYKTDLIEGFELLELSINKLYSNHEKDLAKRALEINKKKRP